MTECSILNVGVVDDVMLGAAEPPRTSAARLADAVYLALGRRAGIIQISLDFAFLPHEARSLIAAIDAAVRRGVLVIVAAGQRPFAAPNPLLSIGGVIPVSGEDRNGRPLHSLDRSAVLSVCGISAPAIDIPGAAVPMGTALRSGTSFAACFVTAAAALMCCAVPGMTARAAAGRLVATRVAPRRNGLPIPLDADGCF
jgi:subtilisin family serine protease